MKNCLKCFIAIGLFLSLKANAQAPEKVTAIAKYHFLHVRDTTQRGAPYTEEMQLLLSKSSSEYSSWDEIESKKMLKKQVYDQIKNAPDPNHLDLTINGGRPVTAEKYFQYPLKNKLMIVHELVNNYITEEPMPAIAWKIASDTMSVKGYLCQKALTHFKGRDYEAWFCSSLPFHAGPWKLNGLPGLILQASDSKKEVIFQLEGLQSISDGTLELPADAAVISQKDFDKLVDLKKKDPHAFYSMPSNKNAKGGMFDDIDPSKINSINVKEPSVDFSKIINNPIELAEKQ